MDTIFCYFRREQFVLFGERLESDRQTPSWLGLPNNAEKVLLTNLGKIKQNY
jgi:dynein heavy chain 1